MLFDGFWLGHARDQIAHEPSSLSRTVCFFNLLTVVGRENAHFSFGFSGVRINLEQSSNDLTLSLSLQRKARRLDHISPCKLLKNLHFLHPAANPGIWSPSRDSMSA